VQSPTFVRQVDWIDRTFPHRSTEAARAAGRVKASKKAAAAAAGTTASAPTDVATSASQSTSTPSSSANPVFGHKGFGSTTRPKVQYYCLMSTAQAYTDFHVDFGGEFVVSRGEWGRDWLCIQNTLPFYLNFLEAVSCPLLRSWECLYFPQDLHNL
jgi:hypothetical protein